MAGKQNILIVDDDRDLCDMLVKYLELKGFETDVAYSGEEALGKFPGNRYDLIILDIMMPGIDGYEVCQRLKIHRDYNSIPILMLSAKSTEQDRIVGLKTGADAYINKPFEIQNLFKSIQDTLEKSRRAREETGVQHTISFEFESSFSYLEQVNELIGQLFRRTNLSADEIWELKLALHELGINAIEHGNKMNPDKQVMISCRIFADRLEFSIKDEGEGFDFGKLPDPTCDEAIVRDRGRGLFLVSQLVNKVVYEENGSKVRMTRYLDGGKNNRC